MKGRCYNKNVESYEFYGGRGIKVCDRWLGKSGFDYFKLDVGEKPEPSYSLDRIDVMGDYQPSNVRWASTTAQAINKRLYKNNTSGHKGVIKYKNRWVARIWLNGQTVHLGYFDTMQNAVIARKKAEKAHYTIARLSTHMI